MGVTQIEKLRKRLAALEAAIMKRIPLWPTDSSFIVAFGLDPREYERKNVDGGVGYDDIAAMNAIAKEIWKEGDVPERDKKPPGEA